jgi:hypothetical protein
MLAVAERDILSHVARSDSARSNDTILSRAHLALSIRQDRTAPHASPPDCGARSAALLIPRTMWSRHEGATARADAVRLVVDRS